MTRTLLCVVTIISCLSLTACDKPQSNQRRMSPAEVDRLYRSQFDSENERLEFETWNEGQRELQRDAPVGRTRGGDTY